MLRHPVSALLSIIEAGAQMTHGVNAGSLLATGGALGFGTVWVQSWRYGDGGWRPIDRMTMVALGVTLVVWALTDRPLVVLVLVTLIDCIAVGLTLSKVAAEPRSETLSAWVIDGLAGIVALSGIHTLTVDRLLFPAYYAVANLTIATAIWIGCRHVERRSSAASTLRCEVSSA